MKKFFVFICVFVMHAATDMSNLQDLINDLTAEKKTCLDKDTALKVRTRGLQHLGNIEQELSSLEERLTEEQKSSEQEARELRKELEEKKQEARKQEAQIETQDEKLAKFGAWIGKDGFVSFSVVAQRLKDGLIAFEYGLRLFQKTGDIAGLRFKDGVKVFKKFIPILKEEWKALGLERVCEDIQKFKQEETYVLRDIAGSFEKLYQEFKNDLSHTEQVTLVGDVQDFRNTTIPKVLDKVDDLLEKFETEYSFFLRRTFEMKA